ncbi:MAG: hypothetical protein G01um101431_90 [Parcubacteria group bacterium Gr01-1014_31]|nr:MAG: hypothetical protein G01um101431_90 [Parcubacteria group bacterium Gr01-1014_31]
MPSYNKLIRDRIPEIIAEKGEKAKIRTLTDEEFAVALAAKLVEEANEVVKAGGDSAELVKEIGDVLEVIDAIVTHFGLDRAEIERVKTNRLAERGGFSKKILLESVE